MEKLALTAAFILGGYVAIRVVVWLATVGDQKWAARRERMRLATPYRPPANARQQDFDKHGRTW